MLDAALIIQNIMNEFITKNFGTIIFEFVVLYAGWECDDKGYVVRDSDGTNKLILSTHGYWYKAESAAIAEKISEYEEVLSNSRKALSLLKPESI